MGQVIEYLVGRGVSLGKWVKLLTIWSVGGASWEKHGSSY